MTGAGIALPTEVAAELESRIVGFEEAIRPRDEAEAELVRRVALAAVRLGRAAEHEAAALSHRMDHAAADQDEVLLAQVDILVSWIAKEPATNVRNLKKSPAGLAKLIEGIEGLRSDLARVEGYRWSFAHCDRLLNYLGLRYSDLPVHRARALTEAIEGDFKNLEVDDRPELNREDRRLWALAKLVHLMDAEIVALRAELEGFDRSALERDRATAAARAMFDDSKAGILARKYESANERSLYRALKEIRELRANEAEVIVEEEVAPEDPEELGSFSPEGPAAPDAWTEADLIALPGAPTPPKRRPDLEKLARKARRRRQPG